MTPQRRLEATREGLQGLSQQPDTGRGKPASAEMGGEAHPAPTRHPLLPPCAPSLPPTAAPTPGVQPQRAHPRAVGDRGGLEQVVQVLCAMFGEDCAA